MNCCEVVCQAGEQGAWNWPTAVVILALFALAGYFMKKMIDDA